jgi:signal transduction histidine kinase
VDILKAKLSIFAEFFRRNEESRQQAALLKEAALREQENVLLKDALQARDEFLSMAAHELRTPITPLNLQMQLFIKMYKDGTISSVPTERLIRLLQTSQTQVVRLSRLVGELVEVSRIKAERLDLKPEKIELVALVEDVLVSFTEEIKRTSCEVHLHAPKRILGEWDPFRLEQVVINLLTNALKYGPGKPIEIVIDSDERHARLTIRDHGIGVDEADHARIFERFERASSSQHYGGLGLGLYIASKIVRLHGGDIRVESRLGEGAKFIVELPLVAKGH